jgi:hypothetical protein
MAPFNAVEELVFPLANGTDAPDLERGRRRFIGTWVEELALSGIVIWPPRLSGSPDRLLL